MGNFQIKHPSDCSILVVDDEEVVCDLLHTVLQEHYKVTTCRSGNEALLLIKDHDFDVVISDLSLPDMSGLEVIKFSKEKDDFVEIMIITGFASLDSATSAINLGVSAYLTKPLLVNNLLLQVEKAVAAGKQPVILTSGRVRSALHRMIEPMLPHVAVLSFSEIATGTPVTSVGTVRLNDE